VSLLVLFTIITINIIIEALEFHRSFFIGSFPGLPLSVTLLIPMHFILTTPLAQFLWCFAFMFMGGVLALIFQKVFIILGTSILGAFMIGIGLDSLWLHSGFSTIFPALITKFFGSGNELPPITDQVPFIALTSSVCIIFLLGAVIQFRWTSQRAFSGV